MARAQTVIPGAGVDGHDIGHWFKEDQAGSDLAKFAVMDTTLCALMLQVYYRYLPTYKPPVEIPQDESGIGAKNDIDVEITL